MGPRFAFKQPEGPEFATKHLAWMTNKPYPWQLAGIGDAARGLVPRGDVTSADRILASSEGGLGAAQDGFSRVQAAGRAEAYLSAGLRLSPAPKETLSPPNKAQAVALQRDGAGDPPPIEHHYGAVGWSLAGPVGSGKHARRLKPISGAHAAWATPPLHSRTPSPAVEGRSQRSHVSPATVLSAVPGSSPPQREAADAHNVWRPVVAPKATKAKPGTHPGGW
jgi:hypothetical protein